MSFFEHSPTPELSRFIPESFVATVVPKLIEVLPAPDGATAEQARLLALHMLLGHGVDNAAEAMTAALVIATQAAALGAFAHARKEGVEEKEAQRLMMLGNSLAGGANSTKHQLQRMQARRIKADEEYAKQHGHKASLPAGAAARGGRVCQALP